MARGLNIDRTTLTRNCLSVCFISMHVGLLVCQKNGPVEESLLIVKIPDGAALYTLAKSVAKELNVRPTQITIWRVRLTFHHH